MNTCYSLSAGVSRKYWFSHSLKHSPLHLQRSIHKNLNRSKKCWLFLHWCWLPKMFSVLLSLQFLQFSNCSFVSNWSRWMGCNFQGQIKIWLSWKATENWTNVKFCQKQKHNQRSDEKFNFVKSKSIFNQRSDQPPDRDSISCSVKFQPCFGCPLWKLNTLKFLWKLANKYSFK